MFTELVSAAGIFHRSPSGGIWNDDIKRKSISQGNLGVKHPNCLGGTQSKLVEYRLGPLLDIGANATMDCGSFHAITMLHLQHGVNLFGF